MAISISALALIRKANLLISRILTSSKRRSIHATVETIEIRKQNYYSVLASVQVYICTAISCLRGFICQTRKDVTVCRALSMRSSAYSPSVTKKTCAKRYYSQHYTVTAGSPFHSQTKAYVTRLRPIVLLSSNDANETASNSQFIRRLQFQTQNAVSVESQTE